MTGREKEGVRERGERERECARKKRTGVKRRVGVRSGDSVGKRGIGWGKRSYGTAARVSSG